MSVTRSPGVYIHSPLARVLYNKMMEDQMEECNHSYWYEMKLEHLAPELRGKFIESHQDEETTEFLEMSRIKSDWIFTQMLHTVVKFVLSWVMSNTSINGLLQRGSMFIFSKSQLDMLLNVDSNWKANRLLDLGAGDGVVTQQIARHFDSVYVTEVSSTMVWRLQQRGYNVLDINEWSRPDSMTFDLISCLNLLDRCDQPITLLRDIRSALVPNTGRVLLAVVLPFKPYVEQYNGYKHRPRQYLQVQGRTFEEQLSSLVQDVLTPAGFYIEHFTRLPYLCEGDIQHSFYVLYDAVFILRSV